MAFNIKDIKRDVYKKYLQIIELYTKANDPGVDPHENWDEIERLAIGINKTLTKYPEANIVGQRVPTISDRLDKVIQKIDRRREMLSDIEKEPDEKSKSVIRKALTEEEKQFEYAPSYEEWVAAGKPDNIEDMMKMGIVDVPREIAKEFAGGLIRGLEAAVPEKKELKFKTKIK